MTEKNTTNITSIPKSEQETVLIHEAETDRWMLYSCETTQITKLLKAFTMDEFTKIEYNKEGRIIAVWIDDVMNNRISYRKKPKPLSEEERQKRAEKARKNLHGS